MKNDKGISVIILAGGASKRLGKDKRLLKLNNHSLVEYSLALAKEVSDDIIISANDKLSIFKEYKIVPDIVKGTGPLQATISSLYQIKHRYSLVLTCDMPFISNELITNLIEAAEEDSINHFVDADEFYPFPSLIPLEMLQEITKMEKSGRKSMKSVFLTLPTNKICLPKGTFEFTFLNVNRQAEFELAENYLHKLPDLQHNL